MTAAVGKTPTVANGKLRVFASWPERAFKIAVRSTEQLRMN
jgi:hypothetical protein